jgi:hypothetical protein
MEARFANSRVELEFTAARLALGLIHSWEIPSVADRALFNADCSPALAELAAI